MTYRVGRKKKLVILDSNSLDVAHFRPGFESLAQTVCDLLNKQTDVNPPVMQAEGSDGARGAAVGQRSVDTNAEGLEVTNIKTGQILSVEGYGFVFGRPDNSEPICFSIGNESEPPRGGHL